MNIKGTIVLEGGANRGVFSAGLLDYLMEKNFYFNDIIGVSAGSCNGISYASHQKGRSKKCYIIEEKKNQWIKKRGLLTGHGLLDMDILFDDFPKKTFPFDYKSFYENKLNFDIVATNCLTGKSEYFEMQKLEPTMKYCRASCSMPLITNFVEINNIPYLDGSISNAVPLDRAYEKNNKKIVIFLTRNKGYRKNKNSKILRSLISRKYKKYPNLVNSLLEKNILYNNRMDEIDRLEKEGKIFVIRPEQAVVGRTETNVEKLTQFYNHGYLLMKERFEDLKDYCK